MKLVHNYNNYIECSICTKSLDISQYSNTSLKKFGFSGLQNGKLVKRNLKANRFKITCKNCTAKPREYIVCSICNVKKLLNCFSKTQRKRVPFVKCLRCSEEIAQFNPNELTNVLNSMRERMVIEHKCKDINEHSSSEHSTLNNLHQNENLSTCDIGLSEKIALISPNINQSSQESTHKEANLCKKFQKLTLMELLAIDKYNIE